MTVTPTRTQVSAYKGGDANAFNPDDYTDRLVELISGGEDGDPMPIKWALELVGLSRRTYDRWLAKGQEGNPKYVDFYTRVTEAVIVYKHKLLADVQKNKDWNAKRWVLSKLDPEMFGDRPVVEVVHRNQLPDGTDVIEVEAELVRRQLKSSE